VPTSLVWSWASTTDTDPDSELRSVWTLVEKLVWNLVLVSEVNYAPSGRSPVVEEERMTPVRHSVLRVSFNTVCLVAGMASSCTKTCATNHRDFFLEEVEKRKTSPILVTEHWARSWSRCLLMALSHSPGGRRPLLSARPAVTFPAKERHHSLASTKLLCLVTEAHVCEQLAQGCYSTVRRPEIELVTTELPALATRLSSHRAGRGGSSELDDLHLPGKPNQRWWQWWWMLIC